MHAGIPPPWKQAHPPGAGNPPGTRHPPDQAPPEQSMLGDTVNERAVRILLECNLVLKRFSCYLESETLDQLTSAHLKTYVSLSTNERSLSES